jgi:hypothetical protein
MTVGEHVDPAWSVTEAKHGQEVARILGKMTRTRRIVLGVALAVFGLGMSGLYAAWGAGAMALIGAILGGCLLVTLTVMVILQLGTQKRLKASLGARPPVAFHSPDGSSFFINQEGVFMEKSLWFVPFQGFSFIVDLGFDPAARKLTIRVQNGRQRQHRSDVIIDVPPGFPGEALELLCAAFRAGDGQSALVSQAEPRPPGQGL